MANKQISDKKRAEILAKKQAIKDSIERKRKVALQAKVADSKNFESLSFKPDRREPDLLVAKVSLPDGNFLDVATRDNKTYETMVYEENSAGFIEGPYEGQSKKDVQNLLDKYFTVKLKDSKSLKYRKFRVMDSYKSLVKKIKDDMEETVNTQEAVDVAIEALQEAPAEQVVAACVEVLAGTVDVLQENVATLAEAVPEVPEEEVVEEEETKVEDSAKKIQDAIARAKAILKGKK